VTNTISAVDVSSNWQTLLAQAYTSPRELLEFLSIDPQQLSLATSDALDFPCRVPLPFARLMQPGDVNDPLLRQVLPLSAELEPVPGYSADPLAEAQASPQDGIIQKYHGRVLLVAASACAVNCRYCFRRHFPYQEQTATGSELLDALDFIASHDDISEVILSGGDPLVLGERRFAELVTQLAQIPHVRRLRIHSRLPIVLPQRVTPELLAVLQDTRLQVVMVVHSNHANEISAEVRVGFAQLRAAGITLFNQSVLLAGVNDSASVLAQLSETLFDAGVTPYYLHQLDPVAGAAHFAVPLSRARRLHHELLALLPGFLVPRLVSELPGQVSKTHL
jgi:EF-P beta-lysylation protein EpmB